MSFAEIIITSIPPGNAVNDGRFHWYQAGKTLRRCSAEMPEHFYTLHPNPSRLGWFFSLVKLNIL